MYSFRQLLEKKLDRKEFLAHLGALFLALVGISAILKALSNPNILDKKHQYGFGSGPYEGKSRRIP